MAQLRLGIRALYADAEDLQAQMEKPGRRIDHRDTPISRVSFGGGGGGTPP